MSRGTRRRSTGMMVVGIIFTGLGAVAMGAGTGIYFGKGGCDDAPLIQRGIEGDFGPTPCNVSAKQKAGMSIMLAGLITAALGVPLWVLGASDVPWPEAAGNERAPARPSWARFVPSVVPARRGATLGWQF